MIDLIKKYFNLGLNKLYKTYNDTFKRVNIRRIRIFSIIVLITCIIRIILAYTVDNNHQLAIVVIIYGILNLINLLFSFTILPKLSVKKIDYDVYACLLSALGIGIYVSIWGNAAHNLSFILICAFALLPILFNLFPGEQFAFFLPALAIFLILDFIYKDSLTCYYDLIYSLLATFTGFVISWEKNHNEYKNIVMILKLVNQNQVGKDSIHNDKTTGLFNKQATKDVINEYLANKPVDARDALIILDINQWRKINEKFKKPVVNDLLSQIAKGLIDLFRKSDIVGILDDGQFVILMKDFHTDSIINYKIDRVFSFIERDVSLPDYSVITCSVGVCIISRLHHYDEALAIAQNAVNKAREEASINNVNNSSIFNDYHQTF